MFKKIYSIFICCFLFFNLFGCNSSSDNANTNSTSNKTTIRFSWWGGEGRHDITVKAIEEFEKKYPSIKVKLEFAEWEGFKKKMNVKVAGNDEPDVMQINYDWLESYSKDGSGFYDLNKLSDDIDLSNFSDDILQYGTKNNVLNAIPIAMNAKMMYYDKSVMDKYGLEEFTTWDSMLNSKSKINDANEYLLKLDEINSWTFAMTYIKDKTGKDFLTSDNTLGFSQDDIKDLLTFYKSLLDNKILQPLNDVNNYNFDSKDSASLSTWSSDASKIEKSVKNSNSEAIISPFPSLTGSNPITYVKPSMLYAISKNTEHPKEAALLMNFLLNNEDAAKILGLDRGIPCSKSAYDALEKDNQLKGLQFEGIKKISDTQNVLINPYYENTLVKNVYNEAIKEVNYGTASIDEIAAKTYSELNKVLETLK